MRCAYKRQTRSATVCPPKCFSVVTVTFCVNVLSKEKLSKPSEGKGTAQSPHVAVRLEWLHKHYKVKVYDASILINPANVECGTLAWGHLTDTSFFNRR